MLELSTDALTLFYDPSAAPRGAGFVATTLRVALADGRAWRAGDAPLGSLHGTIRTLDRVGKTVGLRCTQPAYRNDSHCEEGVASRDGWAVVDDSLGPRWDTLHYGAGGGGGKAAANGGARRRPRLALGHGCCRTAHKGGHGARPFNLRRGGV